MLSRRSFLQVTGAALAALGIPQGIKVFDEPLVETHPAEWIVDKGAYYEVWVPAGKSLTKEHFDKPIVLFMGMLSRFSECSVEGFTTIYGQKIIVRGCRFDGGDMQGTAPHRTSMIYLPAEVRDITLIGCYISAPQTMPWVFAGEGVERANLSSNMADLWSVDYSKRV